MAAVGERATYYPIKKEKDDNRHWPCVVEAVGPKRLKVRVFREGIDPEGRVLWCSLRRLVFGQGELVSG